MDYSIGKPRLAREIAGLAVRPIDPKLTDSLLADLKEKAKNLDPRDKPGADAILAVIDRLMEPVIKSRPLIEKISSQEFQGAGTIRTLQELEARLAAIESFRSDAKEMLSLYQNLEAMRKTELTQRNLTATFVSQYTDGFMKSAHRKIALPIVQSND